MSQDWQTNFHDLGRGDQSHQWLCLSLRRCLTRFAPLWAMDSTSALPSWIVHFLVGGTCDQDFAAVIQIEFA